MNTIYTPGNNDQINAAAADQAVFVGEGGFLCGAYSIINGRVVVASDLLLTDVNCQLKGSARAQKLQMNDYSLITGNVVVQSTSAIAYGVNSRIDGTKTSDAPEASWAPSPLPRVDYTRTDWTGFTNATWPGAGCSLNGTVTLAQTSPTVIDTRAACPNGIVNTASNSVLELRGDVVLVVNKFLTTDNLRIRSSSPHKLWIINPAPSSADCSSTETVSFGDFTYFEQVTALLYSDCKATLHENIVWPGQVYADNLTWHTYVHVNYAEVGGPLFSDGGAAVLSKAVTQ